MLLLLWISCCDAAACSLLTGWHAHGAVGSGDSTSVAAIVFRAGKVKELCARQKVDREVVIQVVWTVLEVELLTASILLPLSARAVHDGETSTGSVIVSMCLG